ncbi:hypothetical protein BDP27DRAFT_284668 [Rhodocollybia butyracea]|uniref:Uncharacterized protein n=1 Tax=Rhodocollybia butyracea TaxID=206335 RepID=A0A9P5Q4T4_9AGAR|nr:hypothetical protein BDP27DRAFT_284668 [Rhodocollybia butyracea]
MVVVVPSLANALVIRLLNFSSILQASSIPAGLSSILLVNNYALISSGPVVKSWKPPPISESFQRSEIGLPGPFVHSTLSKPRSFSNHLPTCPMFHHLFRPHISTEFRTSCAFVELA